MVLTVSFVLSPVTMLFCHRRPADMVLSKARLGRLASAKLDASLGASEPHDFAVREKRRSSACHSSAHGPYDPPCHPLTSPDAAASTASRPAFVTIAKRPSVGTGWLGYASDLG